MRATRCAFLCAAALAATVPACSGRSSRSSPPPGPSAAGEFVAWQILGGGHATRAMVTGDVDGDGDNDVLEVNYGEQSRLLINNGAGELTDGTDLVGASTTGLPAMSALSRTAVFADLDGDGDLDVVIGNNGPNTLLRNNGAGEFTDATAGNLPPAVDDTWAIAVIDVDGDGDLDLVIGNTGQNQLLLNDGKAKFFIGTDLAGTISTGLPAISDATRGLYVADLDSDGDQDLAVANDDGGQDRILLNNGVGEFTDGTFGATTGLPVLADHSRAVVVKNFDATTGVDLLFVGQGVPRLLLNNGSGFFHDATTDWARQIPGQTDTWRGLYVASATALFAVGDNGTIRFNNGSGTWGNQGSGVTAHLRGVGGTSATNVYAVGDAGTMIAWNGTVWGSAITNPAQPSAPYPGDNLLGVTIVASGGGGSEYWTVGTNAMLAKSTNGTTWTQVTGTDNPVYTAAVTGPPYVAPSGPALRAVVGFTGSTDTIVYAVGDNGTILRKADGATAWTQQTSNTARHLYAVFATSATSLWAVGEGGTILRSTDGTTWSLQPSGTNRDLFGIWGADANNLWVVGRGGEVLVTTNGGTTWTPDNPGTHADLLAVGGTSTTNVYAVGLLATIVRETGATATTGVPTTPLDAWGVVAFDVDNGAPFLDDLVIATSGQDVVYLNYNGSVAGSFSDVSGTALTNRPADDSRGVTAALLNGGGAMDLLWANTGQNRLDLGQTGGTFNDGTDTAGTGPTGLPLWFDARDGAVGDVNGDGVHDIVLAVRGGQNRLYVRQGFGFADRTATNMPADTDPSEGVVLVDVDGDGDLDLVFANNGGQNRLYTNNGAGVFTNAAGALPADTDPSVDVTFGDVDGDGDRDLVFANAGAQNKLYRNNGSGVFTDVTGTTLPVDTDPSQDVVLADIDNDGDRDLVVANGARWRVDSTSFTDNLYGVSAVSSTDVWAVGASGRVAHWNGTSWTGTVESAAGGNTLRAVYAIAQNDVVAVGDNATFLRYNGTSWSADAAPSGMGAGDHLRGVHGTGPSDLHAVGVNGIICRNTGSGWTRIAQGVTPASLNGVHSVAGPFAVAVGQGTAPLAVVWNGTFWATLNPPGTPTLNAVTGVSGSDAIAVGAAGVALRYRGFTWSTIASGVTAALNGVAAHSVGGVLAVGAGGTATRDTGGGFAAEAVGTVSTALNAVTWADSAHAVTVGDGGVIAQWQGARNRLLRNNGAGVFTDVTATAMPTPDLDDTSDGTLADVDLDGDLDIFFANRRGQNRLYINNGIGSGNFSDGTDLAQVATTGLEPESDDSRAAMFLTARGTQWDLLVAVRGAQNRLLLNQGGGEFRDSTDEGNAASFGLAIDRTDTYSVKGGDFDLNGLVDPVFVHAGGAVVLLHR